MFIHLEELQGFATRKNSGKLKAFITKSDMLVNHKGIIPYQKDIYHRYFATTNEVMPVKVEEGDRRYAIFFAGSANKGNHAYWERVAELFHDEGVLAGMFERFMTTNIAGWNPRNIVETQEKKNLQQNEVSYEQHFLVHLADQSITKYDNDSLYKEYVAWCATQKLMPSSKNHFGRLLTPFITKGWITTGRSTTQRYVVINAETIKGAQPAD
jgi:phage/plasmid-associated DNA primase